MNISHALKNHGKNITQERLDIFDGIKNLHLFQAIDVREMFPLIGRASIFRTLSLFVGIGILRKLSLEDR